MYEINFDAKNNTVTVTQTVSTVILDGEAVTELGYDGITTELTIDLTKMEDIERLKDAGSVKTKFSGFKKELSQIHPNFGVPIKKEFDELLKSVDKEIPKVEESKKQMNVAVMNMSKKFLIDSNF